MTEPREMVGGRQTARPCADDEHPATAAGRGTVVLPSLLECQVAQESLDRMDRARRCRDQPGCRRSRTGGSRHARGSRGTDCRRPARARPARAGPTWYARARPGCSPRRAARVARWQQIDVEGSALPDRARVRPPMQQVRQRRHVLHRVAHAGHRNPTAITPRLTGCGRLPTTGGTGLEPVTPS